MYGFQADRGDRSTWTYHTLSTRITLAGFLSTPCRVQH